MHLVTSWQAETWYPSMHPHIPSGIQTILGCACSGHIFTHPSHICSLPYLQMLPISLSEESQTHIQTASRHIWHLRIGGIPTVSQGSKTYLSVSRKVSNISSQARARDVGGT